MRTRFITAGAALVLSSYVTMYHDMLVCLPLGLLGFALILRELPADDYNEVLHTDVAQYLREKLATIRAS